MEEISYFHGEGLELSSKLENHWNNPLKSDYLFRILEISITDTLSCLCPNLSAVTFTFLMSVIHIYPPPFLTIVQFVFIVLVMR